MNIKSLFWVILTSAFAPYCYTQDSLDYADTIRLDAVVFVGQRIETALSERPEAISVLNAKKLNELSPMNMPDVMGAMPGVFMQKTNNGGGSPFLRGLTGYHTLILMDGIRLNNAIFRSGPNQYLNTVDPYMLDQIEVLRGPGSVQYGTDAIGGTIGLRSNKLHFSENGLTIGGELYGKWMSRDMEKTGRAQVQISTPRVAVTGGLTRKDFGNIVAGAEQGKLDYTSYDEYSADIKAGVKLAPSQTLTLAWQHHKQNDVQLYHKLITGDYSTYEFDPQLRDLVYLQHEIKRGHSVLSGLKSIVSLHQSDETRKIQRTGSVDIYTERDKVRSLGIIMECLTDNNGRWEGVSGFELYYDKVSSSTLKTNLLSGYDSALRGLYPDGSWMSNISLFSLHTLSVEKLKINGGLRYNHFFLGLTDEVFGDLKIKPHALVGSIGATYRISRTTEISISINNAFRAPNINDVSSFGIADFRYEVPNFDLSPEKSLNKELGVKTSQEYFIGSLHLYHNSLSDLMANVKTMYQGKDSIDGIKVYTRENVDNAFIQGIEGEMQIRLLSYLSAESYLVYTYGQNVSKSEPLRRIPPLNGLVGFRFLGLKNLLIVSQWQFAVKQDRLSSGDIDDSRIPVGGTPAWNIFNLRFSYQIKGMVLNTGLLNLFNETYRTHGSGVECVGRSVFVSLQYSFKV